MRSLLLRHIAFPAVMPAAYLELYFTPKYVFGCANRGYLAMAVVLAATMGAVVFSAAGVRVLKLRRS